MKKFTTYDGRRTEDGRTTDDDDGRQVMRIAHLTLWVRWAKNARYVDMNFTQDQKFLGIICLPFIYLALNVICHVLLWFKFLWNFLTWRILKKIYKLSELVLFLFQVKFLGRKSEKHLSYLNIQILYSMNIMSCSFYVKLNNNFIFISCGKTHNI